MKWNKFLNAISLISKKQVVNKFGFFNNKKQSAITEKKEFKKMIKIWKRYRSIGLIPLKKILIIKISL